MALDEDTVRLAKGKNLATVVTLMPDGQPPALPTWVATAGAYLLVTTAPTRTSAPSAHESPAPSARTSSAVHWAGSEIACVSLPMYSGPFVP